MSENSQRTVSCCFRFVSVFEENSSRPAPRQLLSADNTEDLQSEDTAQEEGDSALTGVEAPKRSALCSVMSNESSLLICHPAAAAGHRCWTSSQDAVYPQEVGYQVPLQLGERSATCRGGELVVVFSTQYYPSVIEVFAGDGCDEVCS